MADNSIVRRRRIAHAAAAPISPILLLPGECWATLAVYLDLKAISALMGTSHAMRTALELAPLDCWVDLRFSAKAQRKVSPSGLRALRHMAGARLQSVDLHGCTQLSCPCLVTSLLLESQAAGDAIDSLLYLGMGDVRLISPGHPSPNPLHCMGRFLQLVLQRSEHLTRLDLSGCRAVDGHAIEMLASCMDDGVPRLRWLALDGCASSLAPVRRANAAGTHPLAPLARHAHKLYELGLGAFLHFDDDALDAALLHPRSETLLTTGTNNVDGASPFTTADTRTHHGSSSMRVLRLHSSGNLRMISSRWMRQYFSLPHLVELDLSICPRLGTGIFGTLLGHVPALRRLNLSGCDTLGDTQVLTLFAGEAQQTCAASLIDLNLGEIWVSFIFRKHVCAHCTLFGADGPGVCRPRLCSCYWSRRTRRDSAWSTVRITAVVVASSVR